ncbi:SspB-related isopeptide-forming adhesin [Streptococcus suis]|uniref:SspB-related isopeptide-forming adhesin n=1 Tax=Streptococcus suis TaxID=1307 RepID=UPI0005CEC834|nr:SspB-related isopeptide-forming adhesin [Streptococcus suis]CYZ48437.1 agglutinin receptor [Streptococcus suis]
MTKTCNHHFLVNQEKGEKHVFRKSKKYRTLCSVALGTMVTAVVAWGGTVAHADEVSSSVDTTIQRTENPATNLPEAQPTPVSEQTESLGSTGQSNGAIAVTVPHDTVKQAVEQAKAEGVSTVEDSPMDLGNTTSATETNQQISKAEADAQNQVEAINEVTETYKADKATYESNKARIEQENKVLSQAYEGANQTGKETNAWVDSKVNDLKTRYADADVTVNEQVVSSGNGTSVLDYTNYGKTVETIQSTNEQAVADYLTKKTKADDIVAKNQAIQKENEAGLAKAKADNEAIEKRNQAGQAAVDAENRAGQAAVDQANQEKQQFVSDRAAEIEAITKRNKEKEAAARKENEAIDAYNAKELERYQRDLAEISKGAEGYISEAFAQALNLNNGEPQAQHGANTRNPNQIISTGDALLGGYSRILDSTGFFVYDSFKTGETLSFSYQNLQHARFDGKKISRVTYDITNLVSPAGTDAVKLVVPNDPTEGFIAYRNDGNGDWRTDKMEFRVVAKYFLEDGSQVTFSKEKPGVFTHSSLNHNDIGLEYVKDTSGKFVPINGSTVQVTNEGLARSLGSNRASDLNLPEEWDTTSSRYAYKGAIVSTVTSGNTYTVTFGQGDMPQNVGLSYWFALNTLPVARTVTPYSPKPHVTVDLDPVPEPITVTPDVFTPKTFTPEKPVTFTPKPLDEVVQPSLTLTKVTLPVKPIPKELPTPPQVPTVHYHAYRLTTTPEIMKEVVNSDQANLHEKTVAKDSTVIYPLTVDALSPNRAQTTSLIFEDYLPAGYLFDKETTQKENGNYILSFDVTKNFVTLTAKENLLQEVNKDLTKVYQLTAPKLYGSVQNDGATYSNSYKLLLNKGTTNTYTVTSNVVTVRTPGDGETTTLITPDKNNENADGVLINDTVVALGTTNHYRLIWDLDQYKGDRSAKETIARGFFFVDDYPEEALLPDEAAIQFVTSDGKTVSGITVKSYSQLTEAPKTLQAALSKQKIQPKGAFQVFMPEDPQVFFESYVTKGENITIVTPMMVLETMINSGKSYENVAYQVDFGQAYETNTVTNFVPKVTPHKSNTNQEGISIDGKTVLPNTVNYYKIVLDYSQYKDMVVTDDVLAKGFYMVDDYPEEALTLNPDGIQVLDKDGNRVSGISVSTYASLSEAPKVVQDAMAKRQFTPKGAIQVLSSDDPKTFYDTYVKTGQTLVVTLPMTVKNELTKTGGQYENTAYQIDFGLAYVTEAVVNNVPKLDPQKDVVIDLSHKDASLDGKEVALHQTFNYRLVGALIPSNRATDLFEYGFEDNYDEKHDEYNGVYRSYLMKDVILKDGSVLKEGTEVTKYTLQQVDTENGLVSISFDKSFLETVSDDSAFQADVYLHMKRIAAGQVENTYLHTVNGYVISSNTVVTHTPQPEEPSPNQPTPPQPPIETIEPPVPASILPNTGEQESLLGLIGAGILLGTAYGLKKKEEK